MLLTKDEAAQKWCPLVCSEYRVTKCIAAECAAWRWVPITAPENGARRVWVAENPLAQYEQEAGTKPEHCHGWDFFPHDGEEPARWIEPVAEAEKRRVGYCGLAGRPASGSR